MPILSCSRWGLPNKYIAVPVRALLPHGFTLTNLYAGGLFSVALSIDLRPPHLPKQLTLSIL